MVLVQIYCTLFLLVSSSAAFASNFEANTARAEFQLSGEKQLAANQSQKKRDSIKAVQIQLKRLGLYGGKIDGVWGGKSFRAWREFATQHNLPINKITADSYKKLKQAADAFEAIRSNAHSSQNTNTNTRPNESISDNAASNWKPVAGNLATKFAAKDIFDITNLNNNKINIQSPPPITDRSGNDISSTRYSYAIDNGFLNLLQAILSDYPNNFETNSKFGVVSDGDASNIDDVVSVIEAALLKLYPGISLINRAKSTSAWSDILEYSDIGFDKIYNDQKVSGLFVIKVSGAAPATTANITLLSATEGSIGQTIWTSPNINVPYTAVDTTSNEETLKKLLADVNQRLSNPNTIANPKTAADFYVNALRQLEAGQETAAAQSLLHSIDNKQVYLDQLLFALDVPNQSLFAQHIISLGENASSGVNTADTTVRLSKMYQELRDCELSFESPERYDVFYAALDLKFVEKCAPVKNAEHSAVAWIKYIRSANNLQELARSIHFNFYFLNPKVKVRIENALSTVDAATEFLRQSDTNLVLAQHVFQEDLENWSTDNLSFGSDGCPKIFDSRKFQHLVRVAGHPKTVYMCANADLGECYSVSPQGQWCHVGSETLSIEKYEYADYSGETKSFMNGTYVSGCLLPVTLAQLRVLDRCGARIIMDYGDTVVSSEVGADYSDHMSENIESSDGNSCTLSVDMVKGFKISGIMMRDRCRR